MAAAVRYRLIADELRQAIEREDFRPGDLLPTGEELMRRFGASRGTLASAVRELREEGLISRSAQRGRLVVMDRRKVIVDMGFGAPSWEEACRRAGLRGTLAVLAPEHLAATTAVAEALGLRPGEPVLLHRSRALLGDTPMMLDEVYRCVEDETVGPGSPTVAWTATARTAGAQEAAALRVQRGGPILEVRRVVRDHEGRPGELLMRVANGHRVMVAHGL
ncbi:GntR family transcriptional regulator [Spongiactinospora gelatinilytica]|uniref:GntR family transcriptional regulator n=1 Tax=Spongiactinospora gelatinilytica TaxID=2666298 RepID=UPI00131437DF|nr:GntR family transcriptional regulator [Spongiactinospora gelatinilytica]